MKTNKFAISLFMIIGIFLFQSCGEDDTNITEAPSCNAKFITISTQKSTISTSSSNTFQSVSYQVAPTFNASNFTVNAMSSNILPPDWGYFFVEQARNGTANEYAMRYSNKLVKYNKTTGNFSNQSINPNLEKPFYFNGNLRFLKFTNTINTNYSYDSFTSYISRYDVQVFDENDNAISSVFTINLNEDDGFYDIGKSTPVVSGNNIYYLGSAHIVTLDLSNNTAIKKNLYPFHYYNYRAFTSGLVNSGGNLRFLKHVFEAGIWKIELESISKNNISISTPNTIATTTLFKMQDATFVGANVTNTHLGNISNNVDKDFKCMNYCGTRYYIVDLISGTSGNDSTIYELILDETTDYKVNVSTVPDTQFILFDIED